MSFGEAASGGAAHGSGPFIAGEMVLASLHSPREKFWGAVLELSSIGLKVLGVELESFDELLRAAREQEPLALAVVFFPVHRIERIELDTAAGGVRSMTERFLLATGGKPLERFAAWLVTGCEGNVKRASALAGLSEPELRRWLDA